MPYVKGDEDELTDLQELCAAKLRERASIAAASMPVLTEWQGNLFKLAEQEENKARCIILFPPVPKVESPNTPGPYFDEIVINFRVQILPELLEETEKRAMYWAMEILKEFHLSKLDDEDYSCAFTIVPDTPNPVPRDHARLNIYDIYFKTSFGLTQA